MHGVWDLRISIHAPRAGRDSGLSVNIHKVSNFNPRAPCGARPSKSTKAITASTFQSTRPVRGATTPGKPPTLYPDISIHAPRAGRDNSGSSGWQLADDFNPRAPCGARPRFTWPAGYDTTFQSTRPVRGATLLSVLVYLIIIFQSTRPVRGATLLFLRLKLRRIHFNPRAPCGARLCLCP